MDYQPSYAPFAKAKAGEMGALAQCSARRRRTMFPVVDVPRGPKEKPSSEELEKQISTSIQQMGTAFDADSQFALDLFDLRLDLRLPQGTHPVRRVFEDLRKRGLRPTPCTGFDRDPDYQNAALKEASSNETGLAIRLLWTDLETPDFTNIQLADALNEWNVDPSNIDVIFDLRNIFSASNNELAGVVSTALNELTGIDSFRKVILAGHSLPQVITDAVSPQKSGFVERKEWTVWNLLRDANQSARIPIYGDYGIVPPDYSDIPPELLGNVMGPKVRYTLEQHWFVARGKRFQDHPDGFKQYHDLAQQVVALPGFCGSTFSYGDDQILRKSKRQGGTGNAAQWVKIDSNHHYSFVADQLAGIQ